LIAFIIIAFIFIYNKEKYSHLGELHNVPYLPPQFLERPKYFNLIKNELIKKSRADQNKIVGMVGVQGMGGVGKTILATALARDEDIRKAFPDGISWLAIGLPTGDDEESFIAQKQRTLVDILEIKDAANFANSQGGKAFLESHLKNKTCLIILDDVWHMKHADAFNVLGHKGRLLITTRVGEVLTDLGARKIPIDLLDKPDARKLLANWAGQDIRELPEDTTSSIIEKCGRLPLALAMVASMVRVREDKATVWKDALAQLQKVDLESFKRHFPDYQYTDLLIAITVSLDDLGPQNRDKYLDFAVFPEDQTIPEDVFITFWGKKYEMEEYSVRNLLNILVDRSLARRDEQRRVYLHDLQFDYVSKMAAGDIAARHDSLLKAYSDVCSVLCNEKGWAGGPDDGYYYQRLPWHLDQARRQSELRQLLWNPLWYRAKIKFTDIYSLIADLATFSREQELQTVQQALQLSANVIVRDMAQFASQLCGRLVSFSDPRIKSLKQQIAQSQDGC
jgi:hypothetical protein